MTKYETIRQANECIKPMTMARQNKKTGEIVTKAYAEVNQRIKAFRMVHPDGSIDTTNFTLEGDLGKRIARFVAVIRDADGHILATGTAEEKENTSQINMTSFIENCETSAVGRALGMCGFGIDTSIASYEEVSNAVKQQEEQTSTQTKAPRKKKAEEVITPELEQQMKDVEELRGMMFADRVTDEQKRLIQERYTKAEIMKMLGRLNKTLDQLTQDEAKKMLEARPSK